MFERIKHSPDPGGQAGGSGGLSLPPSRWREDTGLYQMVATVPALRHQISQMFHLIFGLKGEVPDENGHEFTVRLSPKQEIFPHSNVGEIKFRETLYGRDFYLINFETQWGKGAFRVGKEGGLYQVCVGPRAWDPSVANFEKLAAIVEAQRIELIKSFARGLQ